MATAGTTTPTLIAIDANFLIGFCAKEPDKHAIVRSELTRFAAAGARVYAPGVIISESVGTPLGRAQFQEINLRPAGEPAAVVGLEIGRAEDDLLPAGAGIEVHVVSVLPPAGAEFSLVQDDVELERPPRRDAAAELLALGPAPLRIADLRSPGRRLAKQVHARDAIRTRHGLRDLDELGRIGRRRPGREALGWSARPAAGEEENGAPPVVLGETLIMSLL